MDNKEIKDIYIKTYWEYYLSLEKRMLQTEEYVAFNMKNEKTYTTCINALIKHIIRTDVSDLGLKSALSRPMEIFKDADGRITLQETLYLRDRFGCSQKVLLSDVWIASNILLFTVFDGFLENKYSLIEGDSFRKHYDIKAPKESDWPSSEIYDFDWKNIKDSSEPFKQFPF